jgi:hypothetical protein
MVAADHAPPEPGGAFPYRLSFDLPSIERKKLTVDFAGGNQSSDGDLLPRQAERKTGCADDLPMRCRIAAMRAAAGTRCSRW